MPITKDAPATRNRVIVGGLGVLAVALVVFVALQFRPKPQMGPDEQVFNSVDALFTAVTARDDKLVTQCEGRLKALHAEGRIPNDAAEYLWDVIARTRDGKWESAAERLYGFMKEQKREGVIPHKPEPKVAKGKKGEKQK